MEAPTVPTPTCLEHPFHLLFMIPVFYNNVMIIINKTLLLVLIGV